MRRKALAAGEEIGPIDAYFVISPTFETTSKKYGWLDDIVAVGKMVSAKGGDGGHVTSAFCGEVNTTVSD